uniref:XrtA system polysaccharide deacetylase n=1 Tax=Altererythrobacter segetis TaxID=1104773 RepID=UPI00140A15E7|nr:XrtA system polysaccharide deacetylase [Altererythrobacter segetis]
MNAVSLPFRAEQGAAVVNGLSVDVEDWFQVGAFESVIERDDWNSLADRVERNVREILDMFDAAEVKATFFTLGWVAKRHGGLMREIVARGHELASHGWDHGRVFRMDRPAFAEDISRARKVLEDASGMPILGYRAPSFSIDRRTPWAFMELAEQGYLYSSSVAPVSHDHYGWADAPRFAFHPIPGVRLVELPVTTAMFAGKRLAAGGGGFFRVIPYGFTRWAIRQVNGTAGRPAVFYFHPWEIDPGQPRVAGAPLKSRLRHYTNLDKMAGKLRQLVGEFAWGRMDLLAHREAARLDSAATL